MDIDDRLLRVEGVLRRLRAKASTSLGVLCEAKREHEHLGRLIAMAEAKRDRLRSN